MARNRKRQGDGAGEVGTARYVITSVSDIKSVSLDGDQIDADKEGVFELDPDQVVRLTAAGFKFQGAPEKKEPEKKEPEKKGGDKKEPPGN